MQRRSRPALVLQSRELEGLLPWDPERSARPTQCRQCQGPQRRLALTPDRLLDFKQMAAPVSEGSVAKLVFRACGQYGEQRGGRDCPAAVGDRTSLSTTAVTEIVIKTMPSIVKIYSREGDSPPVVTKTKVFDTERSDV